MKKFSAIVIRAILLTVSSVCWAMDFHPLQPGMEALDKRPGQRGGHFRGWLLRCDG